MRKQKQLYIDVAFSSDNNSEKHFKKLCKYNNWKCRRLPKKLQSFRYRDLDVAYRIYGEHTIDEIYKAHDAFINHLNYPNGHKLYPNVDGLVQF